MVKRIHTLAFRAMVNSQPPPARLLYVLTPPMNLKKIKELEDQLKTMKEKLNKLILEHQSRLDDGK